MSWAQKVAACALDARTRLGRGVSVGISGVDTAGKSTLAAAVRELLLAEGCPVLLVAGDELTRPTAERYAEPDEGLGYYTGTASTTARSSARSFQPSGARSPAASRSRCRTGSATRGRSTC